MLRWCKRGCQNACLSRIHWCGPSVGKFLFLALLCCGYSLVQLLLLSLLKHSPMPALSFVFSDAPSHLSELPRPFFAVGRKLWNTILTSALDYCWYFPHLFPSVHLIVWLMYLSALLDYSPIWGQILSLLFIIESPHLTRYEAHGKHYVFIEWLNELPS